MRRRDFIAGMAVCAAAPVWADTSARYLTAANTPDNATFVLGLSARGEVAFAVPLPERGHAAAAHTTRSEAVAFARRPGIHAMVIDCATGTQIARLTAPEGRHFYGHGAFTQDGAYLLTTENAYDVPDGRIGVWDVSGGYRRVDDLPSGGIGPHEIIRLPAGGFAVANGGIQTHPSRARARLNLPDMQTNLSWLHPDGRLERSIDGPMRMNSIRHIDADGAGGVVAALQWQGNPMEAVPLLARITRDGVTYLDHPGTARLKHYAGSIAVSADGSRIAMTGPKGGYVLFFNSQTGAPLGMEPHELVSGVASDGAKGFAMTCREGLRVGGKDDVHPVPGDWHFDNHLVRI